MNRMQAERDRWVAERPPAGSVRTAHSFLSFKSLAAALTFTVAGSVQNAHAQKVAGNPTSPIAGFELPEGARQDARNPERAFNPETGQNLVLDGIRSIAEAVRLVSHGGLALADAAIVPAEEAKDRPMAHIDELRNIRERLQENDRGARSFDRHREPASRASAARCRGLQLWPLHTDRSYTLLDESSGL
jgi:hypothetical protein